MELANLLDSLNEQQREAVAAPLGNILVLAGAGSGKTRVLVSRIVYLIQVEQISPHSILAVTFTNKAAAEMRSRLEHLLGYKVGGMWVGTFHSIAHRILRLHWHAANLPQSFQILDSDDQYRMIRRVLKSLNLDEDKWPPKQIQWFINNNKDQGLRPQHLNNFADPHQQNMIKIYQHYEEACNRSGVIDFAEILLRVQELLLRHPEILTHYQHRFTQLLVDEFQDTNTIQYAWVKLLSAKGSNTMIVGDDDQSIYGWRGAQIDNIHKFRNDFPQTMTIKLEQNYRSTAIILDAANALINHNSDRLGKSLWTTDKTGVPIVVYAAFNEIDEARFIVDRINQWIATGNNARNVAVLYRSNAQSRVIEETLIRAGIAYRVYGGLRFYERAEIKDVFGYLRLIANRNDDAAFERIINLPTRGIGDKTLEELRTIVRGQQISLWQAAIQVVENKTLTTKAHASLLAFLKLIDQLTQDTSMLELYELTEHVITHSGLWEHYSKVKGDKAEGRLENMQELINAAKQFRLEEYDEEIPILDAFLANAALEAGDEQAAPHADCVQLMTMHAAKGLEFPLVFMCGMEEGLFPSKLSLDESGRLEEERRLCYVGMTRAMQQLIMTYAEIRRQYGREEYHKASRFISEIPSELMQDVRLKTNTVHRSTPVKMKTSDAMLANDTGLKIGQLVSHKKFGEGVILNFEGSGANGRVQVKFKGHGIKWLVTVYANLQVTDKAII